MNTQTQSPTPTPTPNSIYGVGSEVEVTHKENGFKGGWFVATVLDPPPFLLPPSRHHLSHRIFVEYKHLLNCNGSSPLRGFVDLSNVRPKPPPFHSSHTNYKDNDVVDAFFDHGWWTGLINKVVVFPDNSIQYRLSFDDPPRFMHFSHSLLRPHMFWVDGKWFLSSSNASIPINLNPHKDSNNVVDLTGDNDSDLKEVSNNLIDLTGWDDSLLHDRDGESIFTAGARVEINFDSIDSQDVWVPATFIKSTSHGFFSVEYYCSGEHKAVKEVVNALHIRPTPPPLCRSKFNLSEKVDAFYNGCWLNGVVTKVLPQDRYIIYCKSTKNDKEVHRNELRPHVEWADGKWVPSSTSQDNCMQSCSSKRKRGRPPRKLKAFAPEALNETRTENEVVSTCNMNAEAAVIAGHTIPSPSGSLAQNMNDAKEYSKNTYSNHHHMDKEAHTQQASEVTNLKKRQRDTLEHLSIIDLPTSSPLSKSPLMLRYDEMTHPSMHSPTRTPFVRHRFKDLNEILNYKEHTLTSGTQLRHCQHSQGNAGQCDETGEKQLKGKKRLRDDDEHVEKAKDNKDVETCLVFASQDNHNNNNASHRIEEESNAVVEINNNEELPFVKNSRIWDMIESMEVFKRLPQRPHFRPLYEFKEESREGLAIGSLVTFTTLVDKVSRLKLTDPISLLHGYLEALLDLERMGFNVGPLRHQLTSLAAIKDRHEHSQKAYTEIEGRIVDEHKSLKAVINKEIREVEEKIEELNQERSLLEGKKQMKDSEIQLLHAGVDDIKMSLELAQQEFSDVASSPW